MVMRCGLAHGPCLYQVLYEVSSWGTSALAAPGKLARYLGGVIESPLVYLWASMQSTPPKRGRNSPPLQRTALNCVSDGWMMSYPHLQGRASTSRISSSSKETRTSR